MRSDRASWTMSKPDMSLHLSGAVHVEGLGAGDEATGGGGASATTVVNHTTVLTTIRTVMKTLRTTVVTTLRERVTSVDEGELRAAEARASELKAGLHDMTRLRDLAKERLSQTLTRVSELEVRAG